MKKYLVISYYDGKIEIDAIKDTYDEAKAWMDADVEEFTRDIDHDEIDDSECWVDDNCAFATNNGYDPCVWEIKEIDV